MGHAAESWREDLAGLFAHGREYTSRSDAPAHLGEPRRADGGVARCPQQPLADQVAQRVVAAVEFDQRGLVTGQGFDHGQVRRLHRDQHAELERDQGVRIERHVDPRAFQQFSLGEPGQGILRRDHLRAQVDQAQAQPGQFAAQFGELPRDLARRQRAREIRHQHQSQGFGRALDREPVAGVVPDLRDLDEPHVVAVRCGHHGAAARHQPLHFIYEARQRAGDRRGGRPGRDFSRRASCRHAHRIELRGHQLFELLAEEAQLALRQLHAVGDRGALRTDPPHAVDQAAATLGQERRGDVDATVLEFARQFRHRARMARRIRQAGQQGVHRHRFSEHGVGVDAVPGVGLRGGYQVLLALAQRAHLLGQARNARPMAGGVFGLGLARLPLVEGRIDVDRGRNRLLALAARRGDAGAAFVQRARPGE